MALVIRGRAILKLQIRRIDRRILKWDLVVIRVVVRARPCIRRIELAVAVMLIALISIGFVWLLALVLILTAMSLASRPV